ncbi:MAG: hypothetical protein ABI672_04875 [Vicinamibacteria bacterium]
MSKEPFLETRDVFNRFIKTWEAGDLPKTAWTHAAHVAVGACYLVREGTDALHHVRGGIKRHNAAVGTIDTPTSGYHETLTRFWLDTVSLSISGLSDPWAAAVQAVALFGEERALHRRYYSFDVVSDPRARAMWVPPDLDPEA